MVIFEWLQTAEHPRFRQAIALINKELTCEARWIADLPAPGERILP